MRERRPDYDSIDYALVDSLIANMKQRHDGLLPAQTVERDMQILLQEIDFAKQRSVALNAALDAALATASPNTAADIQEELLREHNQGCGRLDNARKFLKAEKMTLDGFPIDQVSDLLRQPGF